MPTSFAASDTASTRRRSSQSGNTASAPPCSMACPLAFPSPSKSASGSIASDRSPESFLRIFNVFQEQLHVRCCPCRDSGSEEIGVLHPDAAAECKSRCQNRPIVRVALRKPLPRRHFKSRNGIRRNRVEDRAERIQDLEACFDANPSLNQNPREVFTCFGNRGLRDKKLNCAVISDNE